MTGSMQFLSVASVWILVAMISTADADSMESPRLIQVELLEGDQTKSEILQDSLGGLGTALTSKVAALLVPLIILFFLIPVVGLVLYLTGVLNQGAFSNDYSLQYGSPGNGFPPENEYTGYYSGQNEPDTSYVSYGAQDAYQIQRRRR